MTEAEIFAKACGEYRDCLEWSHDRLDSIIRRARAQGGLGANSLAYDCMCVRDVISRTLESGEELQNAMLRELHNTILQGELPL